MFLNHLCFLLLVFVAQHHPSLSFIQQLYSNKSKALKNTKSLEFDEIPTFLFILDRLISPKPLYLNSSSIDLSNFALESIIEEELFTGFERLSLEISHLESCSSTDLNSSNAKLSEIDIKPITQCKTDDSLTSISTEIESFIKALEEIQSQISILSDDIDHEYQFCTGQNFISDDSSASETSMILESINQIFQDPGDFSKKKVFESINSELFDNSIDSLDSDSHEMILQSSESHETPSMKNDTPHQVQGKDIGSTDMHPNESIYFPAEIVVFIAYFLILLLPAYVNKDDEDIPVSENQVLPLVIEEIKCESTTIVDSELKNNQKSCTFPENEHLESSSLEGQKVGIVDKIPEDTPVRPESSKSKPAGNDASDQLPVSTRDQNKENQVGISHVSVAIPEASLAIKHSQGAWQISDRRPLSTRNQNKENQGNTSDASVAIPEASHAIKHSQVAWQISDRRPLSTRNQNEENQVGISHASVVIRGASLTINDSQVAPHIGEHPALSTWDQNKENQVGISHVSVAIPEASLAIKHNQVAPHTGKTPSSEALDSNEENEKHMVNVAVDFLKALKPSFIDVVVPHVLVKPSLKLGSSLDGILFLIRNVKKLEIESQEAQRDLRKYKFLEYYDPDIWLHQLCLKFIPGTLVKRPEISINTAIKKFYGEKNYNYKILPANPMKYLGVTKWHRWSLIQIRNAEIAVDAARIAHTLISSSDGNREKDIIKTRKSARKYISMLELHGLEFQRRKLPSNKGTSFEKNISVFKEKFKLAKEIVRMVNDEVDQFLLVRAEKKIQELHALILEYLKFISMSKDFIDEKCEVGLMMTKIVKTLPKILALYSMMIKTIIDQLQIISKMNSVQSRNRRFKNLLELVINAGQFSNRIFELTSSMENIFCKNLFQANEHKLVRLIENPENFKLFQNAVYKSKKPIQHLWEEMVEDETFKMAGLVHEKICERVAQDAVNKGKKVQEVTHLLLVDEEKKTDKRIVIMNIIFYIKLFATFYNEAVSVVQKLASQLKIKGPGREWMKLKKFRGLKKKFKTS